MFRISKIVLKKIGVDRSIAYTVAARIVQAAGGFTTVLFIALYLSRFEQGYYYTFSSVLNIQIFFELGFNTIITQFVAYETASLRTEDGSFTTGDKVSSSRLANLLQLCLKWFTIVAVVLFLALTIAGFYFFLQFNDHSRVNWQGPWIILSITTSGFFVINPVLAFLEGLGKVKEVAKYRLYQQSTYMFFVTLFLLSGLRLYASPFAAIISLFVVITNLLISKNKQILLMIWRQAAEFKISYWNEIFPYQWKIALSWISGYFIYEFFNPVIFATEGAVVAGQMGMTLAALAGIASLAGSWINTKIPLFSNLIARSEFEELDSKFNRATLQSLCITILGLVTLFMIVTVLQHNDIKIGKRFLPMKPLVCLLVIAFINQINYCITTYLRCHKKEPLLLQSVLTGLLGSCSTFFLGHLYGVNGITTGYLILVSLGLPWTLVVFRAKKRQWHLQPLHVKY